MSPLNKRKKLKVRKFRIELDGHFVNTDGKISALRRKLHFHLINWPTQVNRKVLERRFSSYWCW